MDEEIQIILDSVKESMDESIKHLQKELLKIRAGKATPSMLDSVKVEYYGNPTPLSQVANIKIPDARTIFIQPWEKAQLEPIERAIQAANLGLNPQNNGEMILINIPTLTEERRKSLVKNARAEGENARVGVRAARKEGNDELKKIDGLSEDILKDTEAEVQELTDKYSKRIDDLLESKEQDIMTV